MIHSAKLRIAAVTASAAALGAGGALLADAATAPAHPAKRHHHHARFHAPRAHALHAARRAVHVEAVVPVQGGASFATVTLDRGVLASVSGQVLTITEGRAGGAQRTATVTLPADARVRENGRRASVSDLAAGQRVVVLQGVKRTLVRARTARP